MKSISWDEYYEKTSDAAPSPPLIQCLLNFENENQQDHKLAIDLGCGTGRDVFALLRRSWSVFAVDFQANAISHLLQKLSSLGLSSHQLETQVASFESITLLPKAQLINSYFSLPFLSSDNFDRFWGVILTSLTPGGRFSGTFFGTNDGWVARANMTFLTRKDIDDLFSGFEIEFHQEEEFQKPTVLGQMKHWHIHSIVAKRN